MKRLQSGDQIGVEAWDREQKTKLADGMRASPANQVDPQTGTVKLKAQFPNTDRALFPNQFVNVRMKLDTLHDMVLVPAAAVQRGAQGMFVYVVQADNTVALRPVKLGPADGPRQSIADGLKPGEQVGTAAPGGRRPGSRVGVAWARPEIRAPAGPPAGKGGRRRGKEGG